MTEPTIWSEIAPLLAAASVWVVPFTLYLAVDPVWWLEVPGLFLAVGVSAFVADVVDRKIRGKAK